MVANKIIQKGITLWVVGRRRDERRWIQSQNRNPKHEIRINDERRNEENPDIRAKFPRFLRFTRSLFGFRASDFGNLSCLSFLDAIDFPRRCVDPPLRIRPPMRRFGHCVRRWPAQKSHLCDFRTLFGS